jgi:1-acyl-sn-glycerol-3-phosphate acyltransferase
MIRFTTALIRDMKTLSRGRDWRGRSRTPRSAVAHESDMPVREFPTGWARTNTAQRARKALQKAVLTPLTWSQTNPEVRGLDHLEHVKGPVVLVANHSSHLDTPLIIGSLPKHLSAKLAVGAAADYFFDARWRAAITALVFNAFPVERHRSRKLRSLAPFLLAKGWSLLLFPEGTRSEDGWMSPLRLGAAHLCVTNQVPIVPVVLRGTYAAMPRGRNWPLPGRPRVVVRYGPVLYPQKDEGARGFNIRVGESIARLWAEEELGWYGSLRAQTDKQLSLPTGPEAVVSLGPFALPSSPERTIEKPAPTRVRADAEASWRRTWESTRPLGSRRRPSAWHED